MWRVLPFPLRRQRFLTRCVKSSPASVDERWSPSNRLVIFIELKSTTPQKSKKVVSCLSLELVCSTTNVFAEKIAVFGHPGTDVAIFDIHVAGRESPVAIVLDQRGTL